MANYEIQQSDIDMLKSKYTNVWIKLQLANVYERIDGKKIFNSDFNPIAEISGELKSGSYSCDSTSDIRRTLDLSFFIKDDSYNIGADKKIWLDKFIIAYLGISTFNVENIKYYPLGIYVLSNSSFSYSLEDKSLSLSCVDLVCLLNGERNGLIPAMLSMKIEAVPEICAATVYNDDTSKTIKINVTSDSYKPFDSEDSVPYFDCNIGFNIKNSLQNPSAYYRDYSVYLSINGNAAYELKDLTGNTVFFNDLEIGQDYVCNFIDTHFVLYGAPNTISGVMKNTIDDFSPFKYLIEEIGSDVTNADGSNATYVPYDLDFSTGTTQWDVISKLRDLYSGWETFFDVYGNFVCHKIPTCESNEIVLDDYVLTPLALSENITYDFSSVKNITEIWGKCQETDRYDDAAQVEIDLTNQKVTIYLSLPHYACDSTGSKNDPYQYTTSELLGFTMPTGIDTSKLATAQNNKYPVYLRVNYDSAATENLPEIALIDDYTTKTPTTFDRLVEGMGYCVQPKYIEGTNYYAIFCGEFQVHAVCMLVDTEPDEETRLNDMSKYNCSQISYIYNSGNVTTYDSSGNKITNALDEDCPYTIQKCGEILQVLSGNEYEKIYTSDLARQRAEYETWKSGRLTDSITVETKLIPFLEVNTKIKYKSIHTGKTDTYIIDKVSHSFDGFTSTIEMHKFYASYPYVVKN